MNHRRPGNLVAPSLRDARALDAVGTAFDAIPRTLDVRRIAQRPRPLQHPERRHLPVAHRRLPAARSPATPSPTTGRPRFRFSPLGNDVPLYTRPEAEDEITHLAEPINVPEPIGRGTLDRDARPLLRRGPQPRVHFDGAPTPSRRRIAVCDLSDDGAGWAHDAPAGRVAIDPELGRLVVAADLRRPTALESPTTTALRATSAAASTRATPPSSRRPAASCACPTTTPRSRTRWMRSAAPASSRSPTTVATRRRSAWTWPPTARSSSAPPRAAGRRSCSAARSTFAAPTAAPSRSTGCSSPATG